MAVITNATTNLVVLVVAVVEMTVEIADRAEALVAIVLNVMVNVDRARINLSNHKVRVQNRDRIRLVLLVQRVAKNVAHINMASVVHMVAMVMISHVSERVLLNVKVAELQLRNVHRNLNLSVRRSLDSLRKSFLSLAAW